MNNLNLKSFHEIPPKDVRLQDWMEAVENEISKLKEELNEAKTELAELHRKLS